MAPDPFPQPDDGSQPVSQSDCAPLFDIKGKEIMGQPVRKVISSVAFAFIRKWPTRSPTISIQNIGHDKRGEFEMDIVAWICSEHLQNSPSWLLQYGKSFSTVRLLQSELV